MDWKKLHKQIEKNTEKALQYLVEKLQAEAVKAGLSPDDIKYTFEANEMSGQIEISGAAVDTELGTKDKAANPFVRRTIADEAENITQMIQGK